MRAEAGVDRDAALLNIKGRDMTHHGAEGMVEHATILAHLTSHPEHVCVKMI